MNDILLVTIYADIEDSHATALQDDLSNRIVETSAKGLLLDISGLDIVDSFIARAIANISAVARLLDCSTVVVGMQPAVAITLVELGMAMTGIKTALNVDRGMELLRIDNNQVT